MTGKWTACWRFFNPSRNNYGQKGSRSPVIPTHYSDGLTLASSGWLLATINIVSYKGPTPPPPPPIRWRMEGGRPSRCELYSLRHNHPSSIINTQEDPHGTLIGHIRQVTGEDLQRTLEVSMNLAQEMNNSQTDTIPGRYERWVWGEDEGGVELPLLAWI